MKVKLTQTEMKVLKLLVDGFNNKEIGEELFISIHTAKAHVSNIISKLSVFGVQTRMAAAVWAIKNNVLETSEFIEAEPGGSVQLCRAMTTEEKGAVHQLIEFLSNGILSAVPAGEAAKSLGKMLRADEIPREGFSAIREVPA